MQISCLILFQNLITEMAGLFLTRLIRVDECLSLDYITLKNTSVFHAYHVLFMSLLFFISGQGAQ